MSDRKGNNVPENQHYMSALMTCANILMDRNRNRHTGGQTDRQKERIFNWGKIDQQKNQEK